MHVSEGMPAASEKGGDTPITLHTHTYWAILMYTLPNSVASKGYCKLHSVALWVEWDLEPQTPFGAVISSLVPLPLIRG